MARGVPTGRSWKLRCNGLNHAGSLNRDTTDLPVGWENLEGRIDSPLSDGCVTHDVMLWTFLMVCVIDDALVYKLVYKCTSRKITPISLYHLHPWMLSIVMTKELVDRYRTVNLPIDMVDEVDRLIDVFSEHGYTSRADFIKQAVREKILELEALETKRFNTTETRVFK